LSRIDLREEYSILYLQVSTKGMPKAALVKNRHPLISIDFASIKL
jgi:hypothetical protein